ncbi:MAG: L-fucose/L-arabinose isomerase family protein [Planctomycetes bacterium]|nr:L-fucose/L-arabinose isomerase family protein [Planctomycetota bacterium]
MAKVGILTFSDGRDFVHKKLTGMLASFQDRLKQRLEGAGHQVVTANWVWTNTAARTEAQKMAKAGVECTIFNYCVWCFPHFTALAAQYVPRPILAFGCINPAYPGMVGLLAGVGGLNQIGVPYERVFGEIEDEAVFARVQTFVRAAHAANALKGETFGLVGGRPMGMYTAVSNTDQWMTQFGVDVEHIDQWELVRRAPEVPAAKVTKARKWLEKLVGRNTPDKGIKYDGKQLTPEKLERQIRTYYVMRALIDEWNLDFCGIKGQPELTNNWCTMDVPEAFLNDPYDWDGQKPITVCSTEADMDAALTMEIMKHLSGTPVLFADVRHYFEERRVFDLVNSGEHATWFARCSPDPEVNLANTMFRPEGFYFPAGGASVMHIAHPGKVTFARLTRKSGKYWMAIFTGEFVRFGAEADWKRNASDEEWMLINKVQDNWPHAFARFDCCADHFFQTYASNHIHAIYGDWTAELELVCKNLGIDAVRFPKATR